MSAFAAIVSALCFASMLYSSHRTAQARFREGFYRGLGLALDELLVEMRTSDNDTTQVLADVSHRIDARSKPVCEAWLKGRPTPRASAGLQ